MELSGYTYFWGGVFSQWYKATAAKVDGKWIELFKDPKTDDGTKKSAKGLLSVVKDAPNGNLCLLDQRTPDQEDDTGELRTVFYNGNVVTTTFVEVKQRLWG